MVIQAYLRLKRCTSGVALVEFALVLPLLILIMLGTIELARYAIIHQKLDKAANAMADFVTQGSSVSIANLQDFASTMGQIMKPYNYSGSVVFSSVGFYHVPIPPCAGADVSCIAWQYTVGNGVSHIGTPGGNAMLPGSYTVLENQNAIVGEVFFDYVPILTATPTFIPTLAPHQLYKIAVYKPRQGTLLIPPQ
jgi:hypothetical protein